MSEQRRGNLGGEPSSFVGRAGELAELARLAGQARVLTLWGAGGIGKTRLALRLLANLADQYPDGTWFADLSDMREPDLVVSRIASVIGVAEEPGRPLLDTLADALRPRRLLLALDNCEHLITAVAVACERLLAWAPELRIIATSREPLRVAGETAWPVPPLSLPPGDPGSGPPDGGRSDAVRLFAVRAAAVSPGFALGSGSEPAVAAICRMLDGLPLAIELAAAWTGVLSAGQIAARLDDRFALLTRGERVAPPRQRTLRGAIDWSYDLLGGPERMLLRRLSVFAGWSLEMAEQVCADEAMPAAAILDLLTALADKSLVLVEGEVLGQARYRMLESIREYAAAQLEAAGEAARLRDRLRDYAVAFAEEARQLGMALTPAPWSARVAVFERFDADAGNLRETLSYCLARADAETGLRICSAVLPCWIVRGLFAEGIEWFDRFLALGMPVPDGVRGPALIGRAQVALAANDPGAESFAMAGLELCWAAGEEFSVAAALNLLTEAALHAGRAEEAAARADEALAVARAAGDRWNEAYALATQAAVAGYRLELSQAERLGQDALVIMRQIDQQWGAARALLGLGDLARLTGDSAAARQRYQETLEILREVDARPEIARCLAGLGRIALEQGDLAAARAHLAESLRLSRAIGSRSGMIRGLEAFADLAVREQRPDRAVLLAAAAAASRQQAGRSAPEGLLKRVLGAADGLGESEVARLQAEGSALDGAVAAELALEGDGGPGDIGPGRPGSGTGAPGGGLTPREREIALLIAADSSNAEIARALGISQATAARHVANMLRKLGYSSRVQVATWVSQGGLDQA